MKNNTKTIAVCLPDIRSAYNIGSIFRTCDAAGIRKIYLSGHSPCPTDKFGRARKDIAKTALGAEKTIDWEYSKSTATLIKKLKKEGFHCIAIEQSKDSIDYKKVKVKTKTLFVFGNEVTGLSKNILNLMDEVAEIPMMGGKESLNVSVSAGIALFRILDL